MKSINSNNKYDNKFLKRFWAKIDKKGDDECWEWIACKEPSGIGLISYRDITGKDKVLFVSRVTYELFYGDIPEHGAIYHSCKNSACCNPKHLFLKKLIISKIGDDRDELLEILYKNISINDNGCWIWTGHIHKSGYGYLNYKNKSFRVHRLSYMLHYHIYDLSDKLKTCHKCDEKLCFNPDHLFIGTQKENVLDMENKGRSNHPKGSNNGNSKLTEKDIVIIRNEFALGLTTLKVLGDKYNCSDSMIGEIVRGNFWKEAGGTITCLGKGNKRYKLNKTQIETVFKLYLNGLSYAEIANIFHVGVTTIKRYIKNYKESLL